MAEQYYEGIGRRKASTARVRVMSGTGEFVVNQKSLEDFFTRPGDIETIVGPLETVGRRNTLDISVLVQGGGVTARGQVYRFLHLDAPGAGGVTATAVAAVGSLRKNFRDLMRGIPGAVEVLDLVAVAEPSLLEADVVDLHALFHQGLAGQLHGDLPGLGSLYHDATGAADTLHAAYALYLCIARIPHGLDHGHIGWSGHRATVHVKIYELILHPASHLSARCILKTV
jgi:hypothetical protein